jgi:hypothetical protein
MDYLSELPGAVPTGQVLVHNVAFVGQRFGERGFRGWLDTPSEHEEPYYELCDCDWAAALGPRYRTRPRS